jgi:hypothetical protein
MKDENQVKDNTMPLHKRGGSSAWYFMLEVLRIAVTLYHCSNSRLAVFINILKARLLLCELFRDAVTNRERTPSETETIRKKAIVT